MASEKECMRHASESVRLAGVTDDIAVRDQLVELAQSWLFAAQQVRWRHSGTTGGFCADQFEADPLRRALTFHRTSDKNVVDF
jgi:hypothetical protein